MGPQSEPQMLGLYYRIRSGRADFYSFSSASARNRRSYPSQVAFTADKFWRRKALPTSSSNSSRSASARAGDSLSLSVSISARAARNSPVASSPSHRSFNFQNLERVRDDHPPAASARSPGRTQGDP